MGMIQDITSLMRKGPELASQVNSLKLNTKSIARGAKDSTFQFPCLVVDTASIDMATTIAKTLDQVYASFTQTWLSMNSMFDITIDPTPLSYLRKLHQNLKLEKALDNLTVDSDDISSYMEKVYDGSYRLYMNEEKTYGVLFNVADAPTREMIESHKNLLREHMADFDLRPIETIYTEKENLPSEKDFADAVLAGQINKNEFDARIDTMKLTEKSAAPKLVDRDFKRVNEMIPFGIQVRLIAVNDKKEFVQYVDFIVGVKTILHVVKSDEMIENIARSLQNKSPLFKFLKWTTGELSLVKDLILNLDEMKFDAANKAAGNSPFFTTLKRLKKKKVGVSNLTVPHALIPNATVVITSYEANYLENKFAINVRDEKIAKKLIDSMFLMAFIIMDEGTGTISILYDGDDSYQVYALETLERDNMMTNNKLGKEIGRMISRN